METVNDLKNDIMKKNVEVEKQKNEIKKEIDNGLFENADEVLSNPSTKDYYQTALNMLNNENLTNPKISEKQSLWKIIKENFKRILLN